VAGVIGATISKPDEAPAASDAVDASLEMLDGGTASLADYRGRPLVVNFFASWCAPCLAEMPGFEQVHQDLADDVGFLGVNLQDPAENGRLVVEHTGVSYDIARDPDGSLFVQLGGFAMPTTVFIDKTGVIVDLHSGELTADALRARIAEVLL
jgi:thiol-disulfide isomerase/thioredoxin